MHVVLLRRGQLWYKAVWLCVLLLILGLSVSPRGQALFAVGDAQGPLNRVPDAKGKVALTFDVTWGTDELKKILAILGGGSAKATFFVGGSFLSDHGEFLKQLAANGHDVGTLGQRIVDVSTLTEQEVTRELLASQSLIAKALGQPAQYFRPPQGEPTDAVLAGATAAKLITVMHSVESKDYLEQTPAQIVKRVVQAASDGDIIHLTASDFSPETAKALPEILAGLKKKGLQPVTLSNLVKLEPTS